MISDVIRIRSARPDDAGEIAVLADSLRRVQGDVTGHLTVERILADGFGSDPEFQLLVADDGTNLVGYALFLDAYEPAFAAKGCYLADLFVAAACRGQGTGRRLIEGVQEAARARGRTFVWWVAQARNTDALAFYGRFDLIAASPVVAHAIGVPAASEG